jgi:hypothetical protein
VGKIKGWGKIVFLLRKNVSFFIAILFFSGILFALITKHLAPLQKHISVLAMHRLNDFISAEWKVLFFAFFFLEFCYEV